MTVYLIGHGRPKATGTELFKGDAGLTEGHSAGKALRVFTERTQTGYLQRPPHPPDLLNYF